MSTARLRDGLPSFTNNKTFFDRVAKEAMYFSYIFCESQDYAIAAFNRENGVETIELPKEEQQKFYDSTKGLFEEHAQRSDTCAKQVKLFEDFMNSKK